METKDELQTQTENKETEQEIYQPKDEIVCELNDKECINRLFTALSDCV